MHMKKLTYFVPVDFTDSSYNALQYAIMLAKFSEGQVKLCHVNNLDDIPDSDNQVVVSSSLARLERTAKSKMKSLCELVALGGITVEEKIIFGNVRLELVKQINMAKPTVIVVGRNSDRKPGHRSIVNYLNRNVSYPVLVVPGSHSPRIPTRTLLASDMKSGKVEELAPFFNIIKKDSQEIAVLNINGNGASGESDANLWIEKLNAAYSIAAKILPQQHKEDGHSIADIIRSGQIDLLCTTNRSKGFFSRLFGTRETHPFADYADVPVLVLNA